MFGLIAPFGQHHVQRLSAPKVKLSSQLCARGHTRGWPELPHLSQCSSIKSQKLYPCPARPTYIATSHEHWSLEASMNLLQIAKHLLQLRWPCERTTCSMHNINVAMDCRAAVLSLRQQCRASKRARLQLGRSFLQAHNNAEGL